MTYVTFSKISRISSILIPILGFDCKLLRANVHDFQAPISSNWCLLIEEYPLMCDREELRLRIVQIPVVIPLENGKQPIVLLWVCVTEIPHVCKDHANITVGIFCHSVLERSFNIIHNSWAKNAKVLSHILLHFTCYSFASLIFQ